MRRVIAAILIAALLVLGVRFLFEAGSLIRQTGLSFKEQLLTYGTAFFGTVVVFAYCCFYLCKVIEE